MQRKLGSIVVCALALGAVSAFGAGKRTPWGDPDLRGTYTTDNSIGVPLERPTQFGTRAELTDEEYAARVVRERRPGREGREPAARERVRRGLRRQQRAAPLARAACESVACDAR